MTVNASQTLYKQETVAEYEKSVSVLGMSTTSEAQYKGDKCVFLVSGSGGDKAVDRGQDGLIPGSSVTSSQYTATLKEKHYKPEHTDFDIFASQGQLRTTMQRNCVSVMNRTRDDIIRDELKLTTNTVSGGALDMSSLTNISRLSTIMANANVKNDIFAVITPAVRGYFYGLQQFSSRDYINDDFKFNKVSLDDAFRWYGINWLVDTEIEGIGTNSATCYIYGKSAIGSAMNTETFEITSGHNDEHAYWYSRGTFYMAAKLLQTSAVYKFTHNDLPLSA